ncbi:FUSC family protein [Helcococcus kunzii]|uniref:FUSC family protein n=1 Tax=Helcococcus kunzii TaxID=40091 RepID=UPI001C97143F|nr:aromatic acid exporter family protein [Helcococcus kunzii]QZO75907.1 FUSC family protein [Helcococcus kunzii]
MKRIKIGNRSIKTVIAVFFAFVIAGIFPELSPGMMSAAAITAINISIFESFRSSFDRIMANVTAIIVAFILQLIKQVNPVGVAIGMTIIVCVCTIFNWQYSIGSAAIFFVFVLEVPYFAKQDYRLYALNRIFDTVVGTGIGLLVNAYILRPRQEKYLLSVYRSTYKDMRNEFKALLADDKTVDEFKLIDSVSKINDTYKNLRNDVKLKMNSNLNTVAVSKLNNLFRMALSLIIELNDIDEKPKLSNKNYIMLQQFFKGDLECQHQIVDDVDSEFFLRYNYEITKIIHTLESIEYNILEFTKSYEKLENVWYKENK